MGLVPFLDEPPNPPRVVMNSGLDGRLTLDLASLTPQTLITPNDDFFIRTCEPDQLDPRTSWKIAVHGLVKTPKELALDDLQPHVESQGTHLMECSGNTPRVNFGLISAANWTGISLAKVLARVEPLPKAERVLISGFDKHSAPSARSTPGASWIFTREQLETSGAFLATEMNGEPLPRNHGYPIRMVVPGWYGCTCIKWVDEIAFVADAEPSTSQMLEFAQRTHQQGAPKLARDFQPATIDLAAMPVRVEQWLNEGQLYYRVVGILWGGNRRTDKLVIRFNPDLAYERVESYDHQTNSTWTLWEHPWNPKAPGRYQIQLKVNDPTIRTRRLDMKYYLRTVMVNRV